MSMVIPAYLEIIDFIAAGTTPEAVAHFRPSPEAQQRVAELIEREKESGLPPDEKAELDHFMELEHILRMAKAKARQILSRGQ
ncbi:MAG: hypothetical protein WD696_10090 [Bryobacteraceae bacterium]